MSHITGTVQPVIGGPLTLGPATGAPTTPPDTWAIQFPYQDAPTGTKFVMLHFQNVNLPGTNRLEVDLGYDTDVFTSADGGTFWTRPINVKALAPCKSPCATSPWVPPLAAHRLIATDEANDTPGTRIRPRSRIAIPFSWIRPSRSPNTILGGTAPLRQIGRTSP